MPCAYAQSNNDAAHKPATLISYAGNPSNDALAGHVETIAPAGALPSRRDTLRAEVVGQLRQTVHDSELAGLQDIYSHP
ncbi:hypothetical protein D7S86_18560 [Pararobbsia silviterrae]|uniref:Uncharacterized protein n=2 Tax=Pararobbsia silviterrae TaxID=1792498 RepID=A0A494XQ50_9BURK|nr:hypothetical protein D7S86_18560 [Pararobbsia silviterrae]